MGYKTSEHLEAFKRGELMDKENSYYIVSEVVSGRQHE